MDAPWAYHYAGRPDRTAEIVHGVLHQRFGAGRGGLPGNDDSGGLSSWYVWASLGLFPVAGQGLLLVNAPAFARASLAVGGADVEIRTTGFVEPVPGGPVQYVRSAELNGEPLESSWITVADLHRGGELTLHLGAEPAGWGSAPEHRPPSFPHR